MDRSIEAVVHDLEVSLNRVAELRKEIGMLDSGRHGDVRVMRLNELIADVQARIEGIEAFVQSCQRRAHREELPPEEIDIWM
jgi:hypothetical protein